MKKGLRPALRVFGSMSARTESVFAGRRGKIIDLPPPFNERNTMSDATIYEIKDSTANPAPLGLLAFGMTTVLLNIHNAGIYEFNSMILAMGIFYGGMAQI